MRAEFNVLFRFLELTEGEVQGRQSARPPQHVEKLLRALLSGELDAGKRVELCEVLRDQPGWLTWFAEQIKHRRKPQALRSRDCHVGETPLPTDQGQPPGGQTFAH